MTGFGQAPEGLGRIILLFFLHFKTVYAGCHGAIWNFWRQIKYNFISSLPTYYYISHINELECFHEAFLLYSYSHHCTILKWWQHLRVAICKCSKRSLFFWHSLTKYAWWGVKIYNVWNIQSILISVDIKYL